MDYKFFDNVLQKHGLTDEPAFKDAWVTIAPLPPLDVRGHLLGLYYADSDATYDVEPGTIWLPPDADEETQLHELGHRFGHYHWNDLSEGFAEQYRRSRGNDVVPRSPGSSVPSRLEIPEEDHTGRNVAIAIGVIAVSIVALSTIKR